MSHGPDRLVVVGGQVLQGQDFQHADLLIVDGRIEHVGHVEVRPTDRTIDASEDWIVPGFIDLHVHGGDDADFSDGDRKGATRILAFHARHGTTRAVGSIVPMAPDRMAATVHELSRAPIEGLLGLHLEGPYLAPAQCGALSPEHLAAPDRVAFAKLIRGCEQAIRMVTFAPELAGAEKLLHEIRKMGAVAAIGHSNATYDETMAAVRAGASHITHLFNAMRGLHHREPGVVGAALSATELSLEVIADGLHLHPAALRLVMDALAGQDQLSRLCLVTDAIRAAGCAEGSYHLGDQEIKVQGGAARLPDGTLAGSLLTLDKALRNAMKVSGLPLGKAIQWVTANPSRVLAAPMLGTLHPGSLGDFVLLDSEIHVAMTVREGRCLFDRRTDA